MTSGRGRTGKACGDNTRVVDGGKSPKGCSNHGPWPGCHAETATTRRARRSYSKAWSMILSVCSEVLCECPHILRSGVAAASSVCIHMHATMSHDSVQRPLTCCFVFGGDRSIEGKYTNCTNLGRGGSDSCRRCFAREDARHGSVFVSGLVMVRVLYRCACSILYYLQPSATSALPWYSK